MHKPNLWCGGAMFVPGMYSYTVCDAHSVIRCALFTREGGNGTGIARVNLIDCLDLSFGELP